MQSKTELFKRFEAACNFDRPIVDKKVEYFVQLHYRSLALTPKPLLRVDSYEAARDAGAARAARDAGAAKDAWAAGAARDAGAARAARDAGAAKDAGAAGAAKDAWAAWAAWTARDARDAWAARATWAARDAGAARAARATWAAWDATWTAYVLLGAEEIKDEKTMKVFMPILEALENGLWLYWYFEDCFLWLPIPSIKRAGKLLHCENGPAFELPEEKLYFLNGVLVPDEIVLLPSERIDPRIILKEQNAEVRREIVRKIGIERICQKLNAQVIDRVGDMYELLLLDLGDGRRRPYLKMRNPSIRCYHIEGVSSEIKTVEEALNWRNGSDEKPLVLT